MSRLKKEIKEEAKKLEKADKAVEQASTAFDKQKAYADKQQQVASPPPCRRDVAYGREESDGERDATRGRGGVHPQAP